MAGFREMSWEEKQVFAGRVLERDREEVPTRNRLQKARVIHFYSVRISFHAISFLKRHFAEKLSSIHCPENDPFMPIQQEKTLGLLPDNFLCLSIFYWFF